LADFVCCAAALGPGNSFLDLDQGDRIGVLPREGMNSTDDKQRKEEPPPPCSPEFMRTLEAYAADLRAIIEKLRRTDKSFPPPR
jgi:hypothetical protein